MDVTLTFNEQELLVINDALLLAPYGRVAPVVRSMNAQLNAMHNKKADERDELSGAPVPKLE